MWFGELLLTADLDALGCVASVRRQAPFFTIHEKYFVTAFCARDHNPWLGSCRRAYQSIVIHPQGKWDIPAAIIMSVGNVSQHIGVVPCPNCDILVHPRLL